MLLDTYSTWFRCVENFLESSEVKCFLKKTTFSRNFEPQKMPQKPLFWFFFSRLRRYIEIGASCDHDFFTNVTSYVRRCFQIPTTPSFGAQKIFQRHLKSNVFSKSRFFREISNSQKTLQNLFFQVFFTFPSIFRDWCVV